MTVEEKIKSNERELRYPLLYKRLRFSAKKSTFLIGKHYFQVNTLEIEIKLEV